MDYLLRRNKCFNNCEVELLVGAGDEEKRQYFVCKDELAKASNTFRELFFGELAQKEKQIYEITDETPDAIATFLIPLIDPAHLYNTEISGDSVELLMRLADKYQSGRMKSILTHYIENHVDICLESTTFLNWITWSRHYNLPESIARFCLPGVACLSLKSLIENKDKIGSEMLNKLADMKYQLMLSGCEMESKNIINTNRPLTCEECRYRHPEMKYEIWWCQQKGQFHADKTVIICHDCVKKVGEIIQCCEKASVYFKCGGCRFEPLSYRVNDQCICVKQNYELRVSSPLYRPLKWELLFSNNFKDGFGRPNFLRRFI